MKKQYTAPQSENVQLDTLMVTFDVNPASVAGAEDNIGFDR